MTNPNDLGRGIGKLKDIIQEFEAAVVSFTVDPQSASQKLNVAGKKLARWVETYNPRLQELYGDDNPVAPVSNEDIGTTWHNEYPENLNQE